jgi:hypothetical protein
MSHDDRKDDWYCKHCSDYWGGHYVNRGHRKVCFKCQVAKEFVFHGKPVATGPPSRRVVTPSNNVDFKKENAKLRSELARLKSAAHGAPRAPDEESDEMAKLVADAKAIRGLAKENPILAKALAALEARISELRATRLSVKPPSERMRQLEAEAKRKQKEMEGIQKKRAVALERIAKEQAAIAELDAVAAASAASISKLQEKISQLAAEVQAKAASDPSQGAADMDADTAKTGASELDGDIHVEAATTVAAELGIDGGAKRVMEIIAAASAASKKAKTGL